MRTLEKHNVTVAYLVLKNWEQRLDGIDFFAAQVLWERRQRFIISWPAT